MAPFTVTNTTPATIRRKQKCAAVAPGPRDPICILTETTLTGGSAAAVGRAAAVTACFNEHVRGAGKVRTGEQVS